MTIDRFTLEEFEEALPVDKSTGEKLWEYVGNVSNEHEYVIPVIREDKDLIRIHIRSSIRFDGQAAPTGEDSIRMWLEGGDNDTDLVLGEEVEYVKYESLGKLRNRWVTRVSGWDKRMTEKLRELYTLGKKIQRCPVCGYWKKMRNVKKKNENYGRIFSVCYHCDIKGEDNQFRWMTPRKEVA